MSDKPITFCGEMIEAILDGRKTETRRVIKFSAPAEAMADMAYAAETKDGGWAFATCPLDTLPAGYLDSGGF